MCLGLDIKNVQFVVNYDAPSNLEAVLYKAVRTRQSAFEMCPTPLTCSLCASMLASQGLRAPNRENRPSGREGRCVYMPLGLRKGVLLACRSWCLESGSRACMRAATRPVRFRQQYGKSDQEGFHDALQHIGCVSSWPSWSFSNHPSRTIILPLVLCYWVPATCFHMCSVEENRTADPSRPARDRLRWRWHCSRLGRPWWRQRRRRRNASPQW